MIRHVTESRECERSCGEVVLLREVNGSLPHSREQCWRLDAHRASGSKADQYLGTLYGHFARFSSWAEINSGHEGHFFEQIAPGAFTKTFAENRNGIKCMYQHGQDPVAGMNPIGPVRELEQDDVGARYEVPMLDSSWNRDRLPGLKEGLYGASFRFQVVREEVNEHPGQSAHNPAGIEERTVTEVKLREFGPAVWGAYKEATANARAHDGLAGRILQQRRAWDLAHAPAAATGRSTDELMRARQPWRLPR